MPVTIHPDCRARLAEILETALPGFVVDHGCYLRSDSLVPLFEGDTALPETLRESLSKWIADTPFSTFAYGWLDSKLRRDCAFENNVSRRLVDLPTFGSASETAKEIIANFESLPWRYSLLYALPLAAREASSRESREYSIAKGASIIAPGEDFKSFFPIVEQEDAVSWLLSERHSWPTSWSQVHYYLKLEVDGYIEDFSSTRPVEEASFFLRSLCGLLLSSGGVRLKRRWALYPMESPFYVYRITSSGNSLQRAHMLPSAFAETVRSLEWEEVEGLGPSNWAKWIAHFQNYLLSSFGTVHDQSPLRRAAQWYFDSECGSSDLLNFVQATVALEILLGDKARSDVVGIAELLANRCAYLLAQDHTERKRILEEIKNLYATRSAIVHRGKHRLSGDEASQLHRLRWYCSRVIRREVHLVQRQEKSGTDKESGRFP